LIGAHIPFPEVGPDDSLTLTGLVIQEHIKKIADQSKMRAHQHKAFTFKWLFGKMHQGLFGANHAV